MQVRIKESHAFEGEAKVFQNEDGYPEGFIMAAVAVIDRDGNEWFLPNEFWTDHDEDGFGPYPRSTYDYEKARYIAATVRQRGWIDGDHWAKAA